MRRLRLAPQAAAPAADPGPLAVTELKAFPVREPRSGRTYTLIRARSRSGLTGWGECGPVSPEDIERARQIVTGRAATALEPLRSALAAMPGMEAAVSMALLDITGKQAKAPLYQVLGGPTRARVRVMARVEASPDAVKGASDAGFRACIVPAPTPPWRNSGQAYVRTVRAQMEQLKAAAQNCDFVLDGGGTLTPGDAGSIAADLERFRLLWFDEPCAAVNLATIRKISQETVTPLGFGRTIHRASAFQDLLREEAIDVLRPSLARNGLGQIRRMAALAEVYYVAIAPHHDGGPVATAAGLHLAASLPNFFIQQIPVPAADEDRRMRAEIAGAPIESAKDGYAALPTGPGLGISVNEAALERYKA
jgi:galactonate dehydratase